MPSGIRATVSFSNPGDCVIARAAFESESTVTQVSTSVTLPGSESVTEFLVPGSVDDLDGIEPVFPYGNAKLYRTHHRGEESCPCECLGGHGCPVHRYEAADGDLTLVFHAADFETLQAAMEDLQDAYAPVDVQQLLQPPLEGAPEQRVFVNRGKLTDRQEEVLEHAFDRGYFERPKRANATELAEQLDISQSTFTEHLMSAQRKLLEDVLVESNR
jgi:predicted DNA binding protein